MKKESYSFKITVFPGNDEFWEEVATLPNPIDRQKEVKQCIISMFELYGFHEQTGELEIELLTNLKKLK
jgi:hypothetical protein